MNYKFQVGDLVEVDPDDLHPRGGLALITGISPLTGVGWYTILLATGEEYAEHGELLTKVGE
jgi:hypothetical protein